MTSLVLSPAVLDTDRAALLRAVADRLAAHPAESVAVVRGFDRASRETRDAVAELVRARGGRVVELTAASYLGEGLEIPDVDLVVAVSKSTADMAAQVAESKGAPLLAV